MHKLRIAEAADHAANAFLGIVLHMAHIGFDHLKSEITHHFAQFLRAFFASGDFGSQVGDVLIGIAGGPATGREQGAHVGFAECASVYELKVIDEYAFFFDGLGVRRHGAW